MNATGFSSNTLKGTTSHILLGLWCVTVSLAILAVAVVAGVFSDRAHSIAVAEREDRVKAEQAQAASVAAQTAAPAALSGLAQTGGFPLPFGAKIGGDFELINHDGDTVTMASFEGEHVLIFFGYANCEAICSAALPSMAQVVDQLDTESAQQLVPVMITVDPERDTPEVLKGSLTKYHDRFVGLTGSRDVLEKTWADFQIKVEAVAEDWNGNPIYAHGSYVYLFGPDGEMETLIPPILSPVQMANIVRNYL